MGLGWDSYPREDSVGMNRVSLMLRTLMKGNHKKGNIVWLGVSQSEHVFANEH